MSSRQAAERAVEWLELQLKELTGIRNATARDPSFKNWRQATLTVMQRIWPGDQDRCERFRRIPFSPADPRADQRVMREWFSRGCQEAARVLTAFVEDISKHGVPDAADNDAQATPTGEFEDGFPTVDLPTGDLGASASAPDMTDNMLADLDDSLPQGSDPSSPVPQQFQLAPPPPPAPIASVTVSSSPDARPAKKGLNMKARLKDLLGFAQLSAKAIAGFPRETPEPVNDAPPVTDLRTALGFVPLGEDVGPTQQFSPPMLDEPAATSPAWPTLQPHSNAAANIPPAAHAAPMEPSVTVTKPTLLRTSIEKVSIESLISPTFRNNADERPAAPAAPTPVKGWPAIGTPPATPVEPVEVVTPPIPAPLPSARPPLSIVRPVFNDPEFSAETPASTESKPPVTKASSKSGAGGRKAGGRAASSKIVPLPAPPARVAPPAPEAEAEAAQRAEVTPAASETPVAKADPEASAATEAFMLSSPVLGATGKKVQRGFEDNGFGDADAIAVSSMAQDMDRMSIPAERQPEARARLLELARRLERGDLEWSALRKAVWFAMEYPELARRIMPVLLPWIDRAA